MARKQTSSVTLNCTTRDIETRQGKIRVTHFPSVEAALEASVAITGGLVKAANKENQRPADRRVSETDGLTNSPHWCDGMTSVQALAALVKAPQERADALDASARTIGAVPIGTVSRSRMVKRLDDGTEIDAERYVTERTIEGVWKRRIKRSVQRPVLKVGINAAASASTPSAAFARSAAAVLGLVKAAEDAGHAIEVVWFQSTRTNGCDFVETVEICLKRIDQVLDWDVMLGACVGASFFRTVGFDLTNATSTASHHGGYGMAAVIAPEYSKEYAVCAPAYFRSDEAAAEWAAQASQCLGQAEGA
jgi:hypothetical protein